MTKIMKIIHGLVILVILGFAFYWFQWRPAQIRKECASSFYVVNPNNPYASDYEQIQLYNANYINCLNAHGLKQ
jgi:hypothetical protein